MIKTILSFILIFNCQVFAKKAANEIQLCFGFTEKSCFVQNAKELTYDSNLGHGKIKNQTEFKAWLKLISLHARKFKTNQCTRPYVIDGLSKAPLKGCADQWSEAIKKQEMVILNSVSYGS